VWAVFSTDGKTITHTFRVAEDRTLASEDDDAFTLPPTAEGGPRVALPHTLELDAKVVSRWSEVFGDYELVQLFPQLGRPVYTPTAEQAKATALDVVSGVKVKTGKVLGLESRRWRRGAPQDGGVACWMEKPLPDGRVAYLDLDPGLFTGMLSESPEQTLGKVIIADRSHWGAHQGKDAFSSMDAISFSELVRDLESLKG
jgi:hypothetical protein